MSFMVGTLFGERDYYKAVTEGFVKLPELLVSEQSMNVHLLIRIFEDYEKSPSSAKDKLKRIIAMKYTHKDRFKGIWGESTGDESQLYLTNKAIEDFLIEYPLPQCKEAPSSELLECNLDNYLNFE